MKNKHAKGPDGQPLININSGRGRGRPKKNAGMMRFSHIEPTSDAFFKVSVERAGGPVDPSIGFREVYTEIYIKRAKPLQYVEDPLMDVEERKGGEDDFDDEPRELPAAYLAGSVIGSEKIKKKRGRKPKSFYLQQA